MSTFSFTALMIIWVVIGTLGVILDEKYVVTNWLLVIFFVFIPFFPFIAKWFGLY